MLKEKLKMTRKKLYGFLFHKVFLNGNFHDKG